jgi:hypothetical protein
MLVKSELTRIGADKPMCSPMCGKKSCCGANPLLLVGHSPVIGIAELLSKPMSLQERVVVALQRAGAD